MRIESEKSVIDIMGGGNSAFEILTEKLAGRITHGRPGCKWEGNFEMGLKERGINLRLDWFGPGNK